MTLRNGTFVPGVSIRRRVESNLPCPCRRYYAYFTHLTYIGLCAYFFASSFHTGIFTLNLRHLRHGDTSQGLWYPLQKWGKFLQVMHIYLYCTVITFGVLAPFRTCSVPLKPRSSSPRHDSLLGNPQRRRDLCYTTGLFVSSPGLGTIWLILSVAWNNISFHALNTVFVVVELVSCRVPMPWGYLPLCVITLGLYLGLTYLVHNVQNFYGTYGAIIPACVKLLTHYSNHSIQIPQSRQRAGPPRRIYRWHRRWRDRPFPYHVGSDQGQRLDIPTGTRRESHRPIRAAE